MLFDAIPRRQCARATYDSMPVHPGVLARLDAAAHIGDVEPILVTDARQRDRLLDLAVAGTTAQLDGPARC